MRVRNEHDLRQLPPAMQQAIRTAAAAAAADVERAAGHEPVEAKGGAGHASRCRIHVHSTRHRMADSDGVSAKACIDGLVQERVLADDSAAFVECVTYSQERGDPEHTTITLEWD